MSQSHQRLKRHHIGAAATTVNAGGMQVHACWRTNTAAAPVSLGSCIYRHGCDCKCENHPTMDSKAQIAYKLTLFFFTHTHKLDQSFFSSHAAEQITNACQH